MNKLILNQLLFLHHDSNLTLIEKGKAELRHKLPTLYQVLNGSYRRQNGERSLMMKNTQFEVINQRHNELEPRSSGHLNVLLFIYYSKTATKSIVIIISIFY